MAEYKYRALGWKDDDIASLNVVDGTTADNQVELQITKQDAGTIDGPAIIGKDGITIDKAADSEKIEISGSGCVQKTTEINIVYGTDAQGVNVLKTSTGNPTAYAVAIYNDVANLRTNTPVDDLACTNKKYVDDNFVKKDTSVANQQVYGHAANGDPQMFYVTTGNANPDWLCKYQLSTVGATEPSGTGRLITQDPTQPYQAANKKYVDEADKDLRLKLSNLEQALNGYILDTTKESYADLDSAVLKNSAAVGDNVYPIADKTRALVTRIEGKTTKMVQLANTETLDNKQIQNGITLIKNADGSLTANGTATAKTWGLFAIGGSAIPTVAGSKYLLLGSPNGYGLDTYYLADGDGKISEGVIKTLNGYSLSIRVVFTAGFVAENITFKPQLFNLTAIYGEGNEPTTVKQFKADFPNAFYPYAKGDLYPAKISGVKFYEKQDKSGEQASVTLPETYDLHGIGDYKDYLEITKNEGNELYTLKKVQSVEVNESEKTITPLATPVETVIATNLTYEQVTAIRHNGGLIEVEGNTNKAYARPTVTNTIVYRLTAANTTEG